MLGGRLVEQDLGTFKVGRPELVEGIRLTTVDVGNPHAVVDGDPHDLPRIGPLLETHARFPQRTNVQVARYAGDELEARVWERGAGETASSGSSAVAVAAAFGATEGDGALPRRPARRAARRRSRVPDRSGRARGLDQARMYRFRLSSRTDRRLTGSPTSLQPASRWSEPGSPAGRRAAIDQQLAAERARLDAAAAHGLECWVWLGSLTNLPAGAPSPQERLLTQVVEGLRHAPGARRLEGPGRAAQPVQLVAVDSAGQPRARAPGGERARSRPSARRRAGAARHGRRA